MKNRDRFLGLVFALGVVSFVSCTKKNQPSSEPSSPGVTAVSPAPVVASATDPAVYDPEDVARMSQLILAIVDELPAFSKIGVACETPGLQAGTLSQPLQLVWDETVARLKPEARSKASGWAKSCAAACACALYAEAVDGLPDSVAGVKEIREKGVAPITEAERTRCAQAIADPCRSALFLQLRETARANAPVDGI